VVKAALALLAFTLISLLLIVPKIYNVHVSLPFSIALGFATNLLAISWWICISKGVAAAAEELANQFSIVIYKK